jgi:hypothetical protein
MQGTTPKTPADLNDLIAELNMAIERFNDAATDVRYIQEICEDWLRELARDDYSPLRDKLEEITAFDSGDLDEIEPLTDEELAEITNPDEEDGKTAA